MTNLDRKSSVNERLQERKQKETATMEMYVDAAPLSIHYTNDGADAY